MVTYRNILAPESEVLQSVRRECSWFEHTWRLPGQTLGLCKGTEDRRWWDPNCENIGHEAIIVTYADVHPLGDKELLTQAVTQAGVLIDGGAVAVTVVVWAWIPTARVAMYAMAMWLVNMMMAEVESRG